MLDINSDFLPLLVPLLIWPAPIAVLVRHSIIRKGGLVSAVGPWLAAPVALALFIGYTYPLALLAYLFING